MKTLLSLGITAFITMVLMPLMLPASNLDNPPIHAGVNYFSKNTSVISGSNPTVSLWNHFKPIGSYLHHQKRQRRNIGTNLKLPVLSLKASVTSDKVKASNGGCYSPCECKWKGGKETVTCINANLKEIPYMTDQGTQVSEALADHRCPLYSTLCMFSISTLPIALAKVTSHCLVDFVVLFC